MIRARIPVLESLYVQKEGGDFEQIDERALFAEDSGIADSLDAIDNLWANALTGRQVYKIDFIEGEVTLLNMQARKQLAKIMVDDYPEDTVTPAWLLLKHSEYARLMVLTPPGSCFLIEASYALTKARRHHKYGYRIVPGSTDAMIYGRPNPKAGSR